MLNRVEITGYRGFKSYRMEGLTHVNLLVGKNNSGKTALLEGIQFLTSGGDPSVLSEVAERRGEVVIPSTGTGTSTLVDIAHFFMGHAIAADTSFHIHGNNGYAPVGVKAVVVKSESGVQSASRVTRSSPGLYLTMIGPWSKDRDEVKFRVLRDGGVDLDIDPRYRRMTPRRSNSPVRFVGPDSLHTTELATMWDEVVQKNQEKRISEALRILDTSIESVQFLTGLFATGYFPRRGGIVVGLHNQETRVPIGSMGDGIRRLMALVTALVFTERGCLFVDEIDTGLHYSVITDVWRLVIKKAIESNIQVFATTHSWDCIDGLSRLCQLEPELTNAVSIHKIDRSLQHSIPFPGESLVRMVKADMDPR